VGALPLLRALTTLAVQGRHDKAGGGGYRQRAGPKIIPNLNAKPSPRWPVELTNQPKDQVVALVEEELGYVAGG
jgi:hypothetical protein